MNLGAAVDLYCERTDPGLWAEPLNAFSNAAFLLAAWLLWRQAHAASHRAQQLFAALLALIGVCSGLFHFFGTQWGMLLDVGSITLFILAFLHQYLRRLAHAAQPLAIAALIAFLAASAGIDTLGDLGLNGSEGYLLPGGLLILFALWSRSLHAAGSPWLLRAAGLFMFSLSLRTLDAPLCAHWPWGTHWAWHLLNACVLYACVRGLFSSETST